MTLEARRYVIRSHGPLHGVTLAFGTLAFLTAIACGNTEPPAEQVGTAPSATAVQDSVPPELAWLSNGSDDARFLRVARHLRGLDQAMIEIGYRYEELFWAGRDRNWPFATYQLQKIRLTLGNAVERRPKRAASAKLLDAPLTAVEQAVLAMDNAAFGAAYQNLTVACNACHEVEKVGFMRVESPSERPSVIRGPLPASQRP